jgi:hypothetical protein
VLARRLPSENRIWKYPKKIVEPVMVTVACWFVDPENVYLAFWPLAVIDPDTGVPGVRVPDTSAGTSVMVKVALPV